jgi:hypothetical protein
MLITGRGRAGMTNDYYSDLKGDMEAFAAVDSAAVIQGK